MMTIAVQDDNDMLAALMMKMMFRDGDYADFSAFADMFG